MENKIRIYGEFDSQTADQRLVKAHQIYDYNQEKFQSELNKSFTPLLQGTSLQRPSNPNKGQPYFDKTLGTTIWYDGTQWVDSHGNNADLPHSGTTQERPNVSEVSIGFQYYDTTLDRLLTSTGTEWAVVTNSNLYWVTLDENGNISNKEELTQQTLWQEI